MNLDALHTLTRNRLRLAFDKLSDRELALLGKLYVLASVSVAATDGPIPKMIFSVAHDYLCTPGRHDYVHEFERDLIGDLGEAIAEQLPEILAGKGVKVPKLPPALAEALGRVLKKKLGEAPPGSDIEMKVRVMNIDEAKKEGFLPPDFEVPKS